LKLNIWQKICIATGAMVIASMFLVFPVQGTKIVDNKGFGLVSGPSKIEQKFNNYEATSYRAIGVLAATGALTILLGLIKKTEKEQAKGGT
jgi:hypothetical protein